jgi:Cu/Ag efflux pump CusA
VLSLMLNPGTSLAEANRIGAVAEGLIREVPDVLQVGRRTGRAELDEHAEGVHVSELDVGLKPVAELTRSMDEIKADIRARLAPLPAALEIGQPISHRIEHMISGQRSALAIKLFGEDLRALRNVAERVRASIASVPGIADLGVEQIVDIPQLIVLATLGSWRRTLIVLVNLPLALAGGVIGVYLAGGVLSVATTIGFITLFGIATRNGILLATRTADLERLGEPRATAVARAAQERLSPILMTALTAALGLLPLALALGKPGSEIQAPMALVILTGLTTSTLLNMAVVPALLARFGGATK